MRINEHGHAQLEKRINELEQTRLAYHASYSQADTLAYEQAARELAEFVFWNRDVIFYLYDESGPDGLRRLLRSDGCSGPAAPTGSDGSGATG